MKKILHFFILGYTLFVPLSPIYAQNNNIGIVLGLSNGAVDTIGQLGGHPRTSTHSIVVYYNDNNKTLEFTLPCYDYELRLVNATTGIVEYSYVIPDGATEVQLPTDLTGESEIQILWGNYCFSGVINM